LRYTLNFLSLQSFYGLIWSFFLYGGLSSLTLIPSLNGFLYFRVRISITELDGMDHPNINDFQIRSRLIGEMMFSFYIILAHTSYAYC
jgi:hypothetical protein